MSLSNFNFLEKEFPILYNIGLAAESYLNSDPVATLTKLRFFGEKLTEFVHLKHGFEFPRDNTFHASLKSLQFEGLLPDQILDLLFSIKNSVKLAAHNQKGSAHDAERVLFSAFKVGKWFYSTYSEENKDITGLKFSLPKQIKAKDALTDLEEEYKSLEAETS